MRLGLLGLAFSAVIAGGATPVRELAVPRPGAASCTNSADGMLAIHQAMVARHLNP